MQQLQINNLDMQEIFKTKFHSNQDKFMEFIISFIQDNKKVVDNYFYKNSQPAIKYKKLNPMDNYYKLSADESETDMSNPFKDVEDSLTFAKRLREKSYR